MDNNSFNRGSSSDHSNHSATGGDAHAVQLAMQANSPARAAASSEAPEAHNDSDFQTGTQATGNVITGIGTTSGAAGADTGSAIHVSGVTAGAGAATFTNVPNGGTTVQGTLGTLTINPDGSYTYQANPTACGNDVFTYRLAGHGNEKSTAVLTVSVVGDTATAGTCSIQRLTPGPDGVVNLPANIALNDIHVSGRDLIVQMPDGSFIVIVDGAVFVPQLVIGDVAIPPTNLAAVLIGDEVRPASGPGGEIQPAAGPAQSSGGNFEVPVGDIGDPFNLGDLVPPTELIFTPPTFEELGGVVNKEPSILIFTPENLAGAVNATDHVNEAGLPARGAEPAGTNSAANSEFTTGSIVFDPGNEPATVTINGVAVTAVGQTFANTTGVLTITSIGATTIGYSYLLLDNTSGDNTHQDFTVVVTDADGDTATGTLTVGIIDDAPIARNDADSVKEDGPIVADGNVVTGVGGSDANTTDGVADTPGADGIASIALVGSATGTYGSVVLSANGNYVYTLNNAAANVQALKAGQTVQDVFTYSITDGDGDVRNATLTITITGTNDAPVVGTGAATVSEEGLTPNGIPDSVGTPTDTTDSKTASGTISVSDVDGDALTVTLGTPATALTSGGVAITWSGSGTGTLIGSAGGTEIIRVTINNAGAYTVTLSGPIDHPTTGSSAATDEDIKTFTVPVNVSDGTATTPSTLTINVEDDSPTLAASTSQPSLTVDETNLATNASASFASVFTPSFGGDGAGNVGNYALGVSASGANSGLVDSATGHSVFLFLIGGQVVGKEGTDASNASASGNTVFVVSVDGAGVVTLDQQRAVIHGTASNPDTSEGVSLSGDNLVTLTATVTDRDGDTSTATASIGQNLNFLDDGPTISASPEQPGLTVDETVLATNASASFASVFTPTFGNDGPATSNSLAYALGVSASGANSGLVDSATGHSVFLFLIGGQVVGKEGTDASNASASGNTVFVVSVDGAGVVTLDQQRAVIHGTASNPDTSEGATLSGDNLITLTATATDKDGDFATATASIGQNLNFLDDGPSIIASTTQPNLTVDETVLATNASASFASVFTPTFGNDGPATSNSLTYALGVAAGNPNSGLVDTATGHSVFLFLIGGQVVGKEGTDATNALASGNTVFVVSVDSAGLVTLDQQRAVVHTTSSNPDTSEAAVTIADNLITLNATATDKDGDSASASAQIGSNLSFLDDGPSIIASTTQPNLTVDETVLATNASASFASVFTPTFGNDGPATSNSLTYALGVAAGNPDSGLIDSATLHHVFLFLIGGQVVGKEGTDATNALASGNTVFVVSVDSAGVVTLDQQRAVIHGTASSPDTSEGVSLSGDNLITLSATATDKDGDFATATAQIGQNLNFLDDGPTASATGEQPTLDVDESNLALNATGSVTSIFSGNFGADGPGNVGNYTLGISASGAPSGLVDTATGHSVFLFLIGGQVVGKEGTDASNASASGNTVFVLSIDGSGIVTLDQQRAVVHGTSSNPDTSEGVTLSADELVTVTGTVTDKDGDFATATANIGQNLIFHDDGPTISASTTQPVLTVDETVLATNASASFASVFTPTFGNDGPATSNSVAYALGVAAGNPNSGLVDTATGHSVFLFLIGGQVVGKEGTDATNALASGNTVFVVSVDSAGLVTLDQQRAVVHTTSSNPDTSEAAVTIADNLITLTATATDKDGDFATASAQIGSNLSFLDDGPSIIASTTQPNLTVDETVLATNASASFASVFTPTFGNDGPATSNSLTYALGVAAGNPNSGLVDTATGHSVFLFLIGGQVVGKEGTDATNALASGNTVFVVSVDSAGLVTLDQQRAVVHTTSSNPDTSEAAVTIADNLITLTATATDKDGDFATASAQIGSNLSFLDDGPSIIASTTQPNLTVDETVLATNASASFASVFTPTFGNDGPATSNSLTYALGVAAGNPDSGLVDTATGHSVFLFLIGGQVVGKEGTDATNALASGNTVFVVSVDSAGLVTLDQQRAVVHTTSSNPDTSEAAVTIADNLITLTATATDKDGDFATASAQIGSNLSFLDDGPSIIASTTQPVLTVDETVLATNASASFASVFTPTFGNDGPATSNSLTYALGVAAGNPNSGLVDTATGHSVFLFLIGGQVVGKEGTDATNALASGNTVFVVSVDSAGLVTLDQQRAVVHTTSSNPDTSEAAVTIADNLITLTATATDKDGDFATASAQIGSNLSFLDDGPSIIASTTQPVLTVDETVLATNASASFASVFTPTFGNDGPATSNSVAYALGVAAGNPDSGLVDTATGHSVFLFLIGGQVVGKEGTDATNALASGNTVFVVSVDSAGLVTLDQQRAVVHTTSSNPDTSEAAVTIADNLITLTATATDKDGDFATASAQIGSNLSFLDDGPSIIASTTQPNLTVDETVLATNASASFASVFTPTFGNDGPATSNSLTYALGVAAGNPNSGLVDTATGHSVFLFLIGGQVVGKEGTDATNALASGNTVFVVSVDSAGLVTLDQQRAVVHTTSSNPDTSEAAVTIADNLITLTATATDKDGDFATASAQIGSNLSFLDDGPSIIASTTQPVLTVDETVLATNASASFASVFTPTFGNDGPATSNSVAYALGVAAGNPDSGLIDTLTGHHVFLFVSGNTVVGKEGTDATNANASGATVFVVSVDGAGVVTLDQQRAVVHGTPSGPDTSEGVTLSADTLITLTATATDKDGDFATATANIGTNLNFNDDGPSFGTVDATITIANSAGTSANHNLQILIGTDGPNQTPANNEVTNVTFNATVNGGATTLNSISEVSETATTATYTFSFTYATGPATTATETGNLVIHKDTGKYDIVLDHPIAGFSTLQTANGTAFQGYELNTNPADPDVTDKTQPQIAVTTIISETTPGVSHDGFYVQFTGASSGNGDHETIGTAPTTSWVAGDLISEGIGTDALDSSWVSVSGGSNGVAGDTVQGPDILNFSLYNSNPGGTFTGTTGVLPSASASNMFLVFDGITNSAAGEDFIVILKLWSDTNTNGQIDAGDTFTTKALMVTNSDIYKFDNASVAATVATFTGTDYANVVNGIAAGNGASNDGFVVIESNDYNSGGSTWQIVGAEIVDAPKNVTGTAIDLNPAIGAPGNSTGTQDFTTDQNTGPLKITNIGFITGSTTNQTAQLTFDVTVTDGDGDTAHQVLTVNVGGPPVVLDLDGNGLEFLSKTAGVTFDYNGDGAREATAWVGPHDGLLVHDANGNGTVDSASEIVFSVNGSTDLEGVRLAYDSNGDGQLTAADASYASFGVWQDANSNGVVDAGEYHTLAQAGITSINLVSDGQAYLAANGDVLVNGESSYTTADGTTRTVGDVMFATGPSSETEEQEQQNNTLNAVTTAALAAGLVAAATLLAAAETNTTVQTEDVTTTTVTTDTTVAPATADSDSTTSGQLLDSHDTTTVDQPVTTTSSSDDSSTTHFVDAHAETPPPAPTALLDDSHLPLPDAAPAASGSGDLGAAMPIVLPAAAALTAALNAATLAGPNDPATVADAKVAAVLVDALSGGHADSASIDQLLSGLPGGAASAPDMQPLIQFVELASAQHIQIPQDIMHMLTEMATVGHDAAVVAAQV